MTLASGKELESTEVPYKNWKRLSKYSGRVRSLIHDEAPTSETSQKAKIIYSATYQCILQNAINRHSFLPNLRKLTWRAGDNINSTLQISLLVSSTVKDLQLSFWDVSIDNAGSIFKQLAGRVDNVVSFGLEGRICDYDSSVSYAETLEGELIDVLGELKNLRKVKLHHWLLSEKVLTHLGALPFLQSVDVADSYLPPSITRPWYNKFRLGDTEMFTSLESLRVCMELKEASEMFRCTGGTLMLRVITLVVVEIVRRNDLQECLESLVCSCPSINAVHLTLRSHDEVQYDASEQLHISDFSALHQTDLLHFSVSHRLPIRGSYGGILQMVSAWTGLETFELNARPVTMESTVPPPDLDLTVLSVIAEHCPELRSLSLYISIEKSFQNTNPEPLFYNLRRLDLGETIIHPESLAEAAAFVAALVPPIRKIDVVAKVHRPGYNDTWSGSEGEVATLVATIQRSRDALRSALMKKNTGI
ncbi:hypothetical protein FRC02_010140 [Tulasnella sp. 418]|nr:hypothetical protein FRC02_010140 [Tulasnella sp. 418]